MSTYQNSPFLFNDLSLPLVPRFPGTGASWPGLLTRSKNSNTAHKLILGAILNLLAITSSVSLIQHYNIHKYFQSGLKNIDCANAAEQSEHIWPSLKK